MDDDYDDEQCVKKNKVFSELEKELLISHVNEHKNIIENPKTDGPSMILKNKSWRTITEDYAKLCNCNGVTSLRSEGQLKRCWTNLKYRCRQAESKRKQELLRTGGGPMEIIETDENLNEQVRAIKRHGSVSTATVLKVNNLKYYCTNKKKKLYTEINDVLRVCSKNSGSLLRPYVKSSEKVNCRKRPLLSSIGKVNDSFISDNLENQSSKIKEWKNEETFKDKKKGSLIEIEHGIRIAKVKDYIKQQAELHFVKMKVVENKTQYWKKKHEILEIEKNASKSRLRAMEAQGKYWETKYKSANGDYLD
ncbi:myb/SANT-like DNA-binding domain-containing protein 3 [Prorops nasuta]|uniref:myb/SANT-like DNA-binding domain-containing protein 3 n=1 Tax=Prorops nasuta TaxID=863751 RepID=UPI0034CE1B5D